MTWIDILIEKNRLEREELEKHPKSKIKPPSKGAWIDAYFVWLGHRVAYHHSLKPLAYHHTPIPLISSKSQMKKQNLEVSLKMFRQEAAVYAHDWTDINRKYGDRRSVSRFLVMLQRSGLDKYASKKDNDLSIGYRPNTWSHHEPSPDHLVIHDKFYDEIFWLSQLMRRICSVSRDVVIADKYYDGSLWLIKLLRRICSESGDDFGRKQAQLLDSFLSHLIQIQEEQRFAAYSFSVHLEQLRNIDAVAFSCDRHACPIILASHSKSYISCATHPPIHSAYTTEPYIWQQKHLLDSLCTMSRESVWLLKKLKDSPFSSPSSIKESDKILDVILAYIPDFKIANESLDRYLHIDGVEGNVDPLQLFMDTNEILVSFGGRIKNLQKQDIKKKSVAETLLRCFVDVVNMSDRLGNSYGDSRSSLRLAFSEAANKTSELINEAVEKLNAVSRSVLTGGGSPLGCIALWRIIFESSLINLRLDCICHNYSETVNQTILVRPTDTAIHNQVDQLRLSINQLLTVGKSILVEYMDMQKAVAEVTYTLGDAFTTGGAGIRGSSEDRRPRTCLWKVAEVPYILGAGKQDDKVMNFNLDDFPWDKHNVPEFSREGPTLKDVIF